MNEILEGLTSLLNGASQQEIVPAWKRMRDDQKAQAEYESRQHIVECARESLSDVHAILGDGEHKIMTYTSDLQRGFLLVQYERE